jgi:hypothetical protein
MIKIFRKILLNQNKLTGYLANSIVELSWQQSERAVPLGT